jgi:hypothetical protein
MLNVHTTQRVLAQSWFTPAANMEITSVKIEIATAKDEFGLTVNAVLLAASILRSQQTLSCHEA